MHTNHLNATVSALADPPRRTILARLMSETASVTELSAAFDMSLQGILQASESAGAGGLIVQGRSAQSRPFRLEAQRLKEAADRFGAYRRFREQSFDRLEAVLAERGVGADNICQ
jgi:DNA-binding transcriptional ArsR family regulator